MGRVPKRPRLPAPRRTVFRKTERALACHAEKSPAESGENKSGDCSQPRTGGQCGRGLAAETRVVPAGKVRLRFVPPAWGQAREARGLPAL